MISASVIGGFNVIRSVSSSAGHVCAEESNAEEHGCEASLKKSDHLRKLCSSRSVVLCGCVSYNSAENYKQSFHKRNPSLDLEPCHCTTRARCGQARRMG